MLNRRKYQRRKRHTAFYDDRRNSELNMIPALKRESVKILKKHLIQISKEK
jgi:hypothetical protein